MTAGAVTRTAPTYAGATLGVGAVAAPTTAPTLLPSPSMNDAQLDALGNFYLLLMKSGQQDMKHGTDEVKRKQETIDKLSKELMQKLKEAHEASEHRSFWDKLGGIFGDVAKVTAVVASIAVAVASCGAAAPVAALAIAAAVASTAGFAEGETHFLEKMGVDAEAAGWIGMGLSVAGGLGSGGLVATGAVSMTGFASQAMTAGDVIQGSASVGNGVSTIESKHFEGEELDKRAEATGTTIERQRMERIVEAVIQGLKDSDDSDQKTKQTITEAMNTKSETLHLSAMKA